MDQQLFGLWLMVLLYVVAGINHFVNPKMYLKIMPSWVPYPAIANYLAGLAEIILGLFLILPTYRSIAAWGIILLLIAVFPANIYHFQLSRKKNRGVWLTLIRLPIQLLLIYWAYSFTKV